MTKKVAKKRAVKLSRKKNLPKETSQQQLQIAEEYQEYRGPIPLPEHLSKYEDIHPGFADRIIKMAEKEQDHRHEMELSGQTASIEVAKKDYSEARLGQIFGLIIGLTVIVAGAYCATNGAPWPGALIGSSGVIGLVSAFIIGRKTTPTNNHEEPEEKSVSKKS